MPTDPKSPEQVAEEALYEFRGVVAAIYEHLKRLGESEERATIAHDHLVEACDRAVLAARWAQAELDVNVLAYSIDIGSTLGASKERIEHHRDRLRAEFEEGK